MGGGGGGDLCQVIESEAFTNLLEYIRNDIIPNKKVLPMTFLFSKLLSFTLSYTLWPVDSVNRQNMYCFRTQWKRSLETLRSSAHWTALAMGFLTYSWRRTTLLCLQKLATSLKQKVVLSASIKPYVFTNLAWDNLDRLEETLTEKMEK